MVHLRGVWLAVLISILAFGLLPGCETGDSDDGDTVNDDDDGPTEYDYDVPVKATSPWPMYRRTSTNRALSPIKPHDTGRQPWAFQTGKGIFHSPVIDEDGTVYIGSADTYIYAIGPDGKQKWRFATGEINDSSALIAADGTIYAPSGDGFIYALDAEGNEKWRLPAIGDDGYLTWWEGHISMGPDGILYAGNDDRRMYAIGQEGFVLWTSMTEDQIWSCPAFGNEGELFFGSNDTNVRSLDALGDPLWKTMTLGPASSSPVLSERKDYLVIGSFDGYLHCLTAADGKHRWQSPTRDHIYATPVIGPEGTIYVGSADGTMYALHGDGTKKWAFDTLDPIRSGAAIDGAGNIYFGGGDGRLYALRPDGARWWSYDTTEGDRNDLNGPPAIGVDGIIIGGESGKVHFVPFDYCPTSDDPRCDLSPGEEIGADGAFVYYYTSGGTSLVTMIDPVAPDDVLTFRLVVRQGGDTLRARINPENLQIAMQPDVPRRVEISADGNFLSIIPTEPMDRDLPYSIQILGTYLTGGLRIGNRILGGEIGGGFCGGFNFQTAATTGQTPPLAGTEDQTPVLWLRRMAVPQPPMLTTFNQIGFDSYNYLLAPVEIDEESGRLIMLAVEGTPGLAPTINNQTRTAFTLNGRIEDTYFYLTSDGFSLDVTGVSIDMDLFRISGRLNQDLSSESLNMYAEVTCKNIEFFGASLNLLGLCNPGSGKLIANGTALLEAHDGDLGQRPEAMVSSISTTFEGGWFGGGTVQAMFTGGELPADEHFAAIVLVDNETGLAKGISLGVSLEKITSEAGILTGVRLHLPPKTDLTDARAVVVLDLFPLFSQAL